MRDGCPTLHPDQRRQAGATTSSVDRASRGPVLRLRPSGTGTPARIPGRCRGPRGPRRAGARRSSVWAEVRHSSVRGPVPGPWSCSCCPAPAIGRNRRVSTGSVESHRPRQGVGWETSWSDCGKPGRCDSPGATRRTSPRARCRWQSPHAVSTRNCLKRGGHCSPVGRACGLRGLHAAGAAVHPRRPDASERMAARREVTSEATRRPAGTATHIHVTTRRRLGRDDDRGQRGEGSEQSPLPCRTFIGQSRSPARLQLGDY